MRSRIKASNYGDIRKDGNLQQQTLIALDDSHRTTSKLPVDWAIQNGWYIDFNPGGTSPGERVNIDFQLHLGTLVLTTNVPIPKGCKAEGDTWDYALRYDSGSYVSTSPSNIAGYEDDRNDDRGYRGLLRQLQWRRDRQRHWQRRW